MTLPLTCVLVAWVLIWIPRGFVIRAQGRLPGGFDNKHPRDQQTKLEGWGKRAHAAHQNTFEAFAPFAAAVFVTQLAHANAKWSAVLAVTFVASRTLYPLLYIANVDRARSLVWLVGAVATGALFALPLLAPS